MFDFDGGVFFFWGVGGWWLLFDGGGGDYGWGFNFVDVGYEEVFVC